MATEQEQQRVADVVKRQPMPLRKVFVMAHVQRRARDEIAAELHISARCVDRRLTKALRACRDRLEEARDATRKAE